MNKIRRKAIDALNDRLEELLSDLEAIYDEEQEYLDSIPENLQGSERYEIAESAVENLDSTISSIQEALDYMTEATA